jgi:predicted Zn-ribbon and HTH transcriptional regulator
MSRRLLIPSLTGDFVTLAALAQAHGLRPSELEVDLAHLQLSLRHEAMALMVIPAKCRKCDFEFDAGKLGKPSKCPSCKGTWIHAPRFRLETVAGNTSQVLA